MVFSFSMVSLIFPGLAVVAAGAGAAGAVVWAEAAWRPKASSAAARQMRNMEIPNSLLFILENRRAAGCPIPAPCGLVASRSEDFDRAEQRHVDAPGQRNADEQPEQRRPAV